MRKLLLICFVVLLFIESFLLVPCSAERNRRSIEKRLHTQWGKREQSDSDELYQRILRALFQSARAKQRQNPNFVDDQRDENEMFQEILKNRNSWKNDD